MFRPSICKRPWFLLFFCSLAFRFVHGARVITSRQFPVSLRAQQALNTAPCGSVRRIHHIVTLDVNSGVDNACNMRIYSTYTVSNYTAR